MTKLQMAIGRTTPFSLALLLFLTGCLGYVDVKFDPSLARDSKAGSSEKMAPAPAALTLQPLELDSQDFSRDVYISIPFSGDSNNNSDVKFYFCSLKSASACDPLSGEVVTLSKSGENLIGSIDIAVSTELSPGDFLKYILVSTDSDGISGGSEKGHILIPYDASAPRAIRQLGKFTFGGTGDRTSAIGSENFSSMARASDGSLFLGGTSTGSLGEVNGGENDVVIVKLTPAGALDTSFGNGGVFQLGFVSFSFSDDYDSIISIALDNNGNLFAGGLTAGSLGGPSGGSFDIFIMKLSANSGVLDSNFGDGDGRDNDGILQINTNNSGDAGSSELINSITLDSSGNLFAAGSTESSLGGPFPGGFGDWGDVFVIKLDANSGLLDPDFGDGDGTDNDGILQINANNSTGSGSPDYVRSMVLDSSGNIFVAGFTWGPLGGSFAGGIMDGFVIKLSSTSGILDPAFGDGDGTDNDGILHINNNNTANAGSPDYISSIILDGSGSLFLAGQTSGPLGGPAGGSSDAFIIKASTSSGILDSEFGDGDGTDNDGVLQANGNNTLGAIGGDAISSIALDGNGNLFAAGSTSAGPFGGPNAGGSDGFIIKLDANSGIFDPAFGDGDGSDNDGVLQINANNSAGATLSDYLFTIILDDNGNIFSSGNTSGSLGGPWAGGNDGFIVKLNASSGVLDPTFGNGDGVNDDGIFQINKTSSEGEAGGTESVTSVVLDDSGNLFIGGYTVSSLGGPSTSNNGFIIKLDASSGTLDPEFGDGDGIENDGILQINGNSTGNENSLVASYIRSIVLDGNGNLFAGGETLSSLGGANAGSNDILVIKLNATSGLLNSDFGDGDGTDNDGILQINANNSGSASGNDSLASISLDGSGSLFTAGFTTGSLGGTNGGSADSFIIKLNTTSGLLDPAFGDGDGTDNDGILQINNNNTANAGGPDYINSIAFDGGANLFAGGRTRSSLGGTNAGSDDGFIIKLNTTSGVLDPDFGDGDGTDNDGVLQINANNSGGAAGTEYINSIILDGSGNLFAGGRTQSSLGGPLGGGIDSFVIKVSAASGILDPDFGDGDGTDNDGILQINASNSGGSGGSDIIFSMALDGSGNLFAGGETWSPLGGALAGGQDAFIIKINATSGILDPTFGDGDGTDNDGILQINANNSAGAASNDSINSMAIDGTGNLFLGGNTDSSLGELSTGSRDVFTIMIPAGTEGL